MAESSPGPGSEGAAATPPSRLAELVSELRRRRVFRALLGWAVVSFAVLQVIEPVMHGLALPDWTLRVAIWALAAGFPVTAALSWVFDLGPGGITRTVDAPVEAGPGRAAARHRLALASLVVGSALLGAGLAVVGVRWATRLPEPGADGRITVAVADFFNETRDPELDDLSGLLITSLEQSRRLRVLTRSRMIDLLRQMGREGVGRIDESLAREVGRRAGARALLLASVKRLDDVYVVELRALDPIRDEYLFTSREQATAKKGLLEIVDRLSEQTRRALRESEADVRGTDERVAELVTPSLEAHRHYFLGLQLLDAYRHAEGERELNAALAIDPTFALARLQLLVGRPRAMFPPGEQRAQLVELLGRLDRLPPGDRLVASAEQAFLDGQVDQGFALYAQAQAARPDEKRTMVRLAYLQLYLRGDPDAAVLLAERALALDPAFAPGHDALAVALVVRGDFERASRLSRDWAERWPSPLAYSIVQGALLHAGDPRGALAAAQRSAELAGAASPAGWELSRASIQLGDFDAAERLARAGWSRGHERTDVVLASILRFRGRRRAAGKVLDEAVRAGVREASRARLQLAVGDGDPASVLAMARAAVQDLVPGDLAGPLAMAGHAEAAEAWLREEPATGAFNAAIPPRDARRMAEAVRARDARDFAGARRILEGLRAGQNRPVARQAAFLLGETCLQAGDDACAVESLSGYTPFHWMLTTTAWSWPRSLHLLSLAEERLGRRDEARAHAERLMDLWKDADQDLPLLAEAKALCRKVGCRAGAAGGTP